MLRCEYMNYVRTTITLPADTHEQLMILSIKKKKTLGELIDGMMKNKNYLASEEEIEKKHAHFMEVCARLGKKYGKTDWTKLVREERDRDE